MHKSQGVGSPPRRGARKEYFKLLEGEPMTSSLFEGIDTTWSRVANSESIATQIRQIISNFRPGDPAASVPELLKLRQAMSRIKDDSWIREKKAELDASMDACPALHVEASTTNEAVTPGQTATIKVEAINRCDIPVILKEVRLPNSGHSMKIDAALPSNELVTKDLSCRIPENAPYSQPYWLRKHGTLGAFAVDDQKLIGLPENPPEFPVEIVLQVNEQELSYIIDTKYRSVDPVAGALRRPPGITPPPLANTARSDLLFSPKNPKTASVRATPAPRPAHGVHEVAV